MENNTGHLTMYDISLLHSKMDRSLRVIVSTHLKNAKLTMMQWLLLETVCRGPKNGMTMTEVAGMLNVTLPQVTALMNELVRMKLLKQKVSSKDRRSRRLNCTLSGRRMMNKVNHAMKQALQEWHEGLKPEEVKTYLSVARRLAEKRTEV